MGILNFLKATNRSMPAERIIPFERQEWGNTKAQMVSKLFKIPAYQRDGEWHRVFYENVLTANFIPATPQVLTGTDGFPYFIVRTPGSDDQAELICIKGLCDNLFMQGIGIVLNPVNETADWVFSYGDIVNLCLNNEFISTNDNAGSLDAETIKTIGLIKRSDDVLVAQPSARYLPIPAKIALRKFLKSTGIKTPKVMMMCTRATNKAQQKLVFNVHPEDFATTAELDHRMQQIGWFLPKHYITVALPKDSGLTNDFENL